MIDIAPGAATGIVATTVSGRIRVNMTFRMNWGLGLAPIPDTVPETGTGAAGPGSVLGLGGECG
jgi:hypothetical protein